MDNILLEIGCDGGSISIKRLPLNGIFLFKINRQEIFEECYNRDGSYLTIKEAWNNLKLLYPHWHQFYLVSIDPQVTEIIKKEYLAVNEKNEFTKDRWLEQLTGKGIGF